MSDLSGTVLSGRYRVDQFLGRGGMADVYKVWDTERAAFLAMKVLHENLSEDQVFLRRFRREAQTLAKLKHPHIVRFYELGQDGELVFMLMEYVDGMTLSKARNRVGRPFTPPEVLGVFQPICSALHFAHQVGLIHCDIKPGNIMLDKAGRPLLTDFGIARASEGATTTTMVGAGTPAYMSPEQVAGADPSPQTDIYSLGVVLYELVTAGERPFTGERATITGTIGEKIRWEQRKLAAPSPRLYNPSISPEMEATILRCLAKNREKRFASVAELLENLTAAVGAPPEAFPTLMLSREDRQIQAAATPIPTPVPVPIPPPVPKPTSVPMPASTPKTPPPRRGYWIAGGSILVIGLLVLGVGLVLGLLLYTRSRGTPFFGFTDSINGRPSVTSEAQPASVFVTQVVEVTPETPPTFVPTSTRALPTEIPAPTSIPRLSLTKENDRQGYYLVVSGGPENYDLKYGPLPDGAFILGDNDKFAAYVDYNGVVYVMNFRFDTPRAIKNISKRELSALAANVTPNYSLSLHQGDSGTYSLIIQEREYGDIVTVAISSVFTR